MARIFTLLFFLFFSFNAFAQQSKEEELLAKLEGLTTDSLKADTYLNLYNEVFKTNPEKAKEYASQALKYGLLANNTKQIAYCYLALAASERKKRNYDAVLPYDLKVLEYAKDLKPDAVFYCTNLTANDYIDAGQNEQAIKYLQLAEELAYQTNKPANIAKVQYSLGFFYNNIGKPSKAVSYLQKSIDNSLKIPDFKQANTSRLVLGQCMMQLNRIDGLAEMIFDALDYFKKEGQVRSQAECYRLLGYCYSNNNNLVQGIKNYQNAKQIYESTDDKATEGLVALDLSKCYIVAKQYQSAKKTIIEAEQIFDNLKNEYGITSSKIRWGQYYTETGQLRVAENYFITVNNLLKKTPDQDLLTQNEMYWATNAYRQKKNKLGDSLTYAYSKLIANTKEKGVIANNLTYLKNKNSGIAFSDLKMLYTKGGAELLRKKYGNKSLKEIIPTIDTFNLANPPGDTKSESIINTKFNNQLLELETRYRTRIKNDSLKLERQNITIAKDDLRSKNYWLLGSLAFVLLLSGGFMLQRKYRLRAEADKRSIELLKNEIHHRVKNNLSIINRLFEVAEKASNTTISLASLKSRVKAIGLLHEHLYKDKAIDTVDMQQYLTELVAAVKDTFETGQPVITEIDAPVVLSGATSEKIGLIVNELVTNSYKYAFNGLDKGLIKVCAKRSISGDYEINISDNGKGIDLKNNAGNYGMKLIAGLCYEINGAFKFSNDQGTKFDLKFADVFKR